MHKGKQLGVMIEEFLFVVLNFKSHTLIQEAYVFVIKAFVYFLLAPLWHYTKLSFSLMKLLCLFIPLSHNSTAL